MSVNGIGGLGPTFAPAGPEQARESEQGAEGAAFQLDQGTGRGADSVFVGGREAGPTIPAEAPSGTDPEAWALLTDEERQFLSAQEMSGPVTYGRGAIDSALAALGSRLDVRG